MNISKKPTPLQQQPFKRKLRSSSKLSPQKLLVLPTSKHKKVIQEIQRQLDNQQSINGSKSTAPIQDDLKTGPYDSALFCMRTRRTRYEDLPKNKVDDLVRQPLTKEILQEPAQTLPTPIIEEAKPQPPQPKYDPEEFITPVKPEPRNPKADQKLALREFRRSGRRQKKSSVNQVPFRKFQDSFEQKIVVLINRIYQKKANEKDMEILSQKLQKMTLKQLYNPYVISGVQTVINLMERPGFSQVTVCIKQNNHQLTRLTQEIKKVSVRIWEELGKVQDYEEAVMEQREVNLEELRPKFIRKIYKMLVETNKFGLKEAKEKSCSISESFFSNCNNFLREDDLMSFFREKKFLTG